MIIVLVFLVLLLAVLVAIVLTLGFRLGVDHCQDELVRVRADAAHVQSRLEHVARAALDELAEHVRRQRSGSDS